MNKAPVITSQCLSLYIHFVNQNKNIKNKIPNGCGMYGEICKKEKHPANFMICMTCSLAKFAATTEVIVEHCNDRMSTGIDYLSDSDICNIKSTLQKNNVSVDYDYVKNVLDFLISKN